MVLNLLLMCLWSVKYFCKTTQSLLLNDFYVFFTLKCPLYISFSEDIFDSFWSSINKTCIDFVTISETVALRHIKWF